MSNARVLADRAGLDNPVADGIKRVKPTDKMRTQYSSSLRDMMAGYPFLASLAGSDSVRYHAVDTDEFPIAATDGTGIYFNARSTKDIQGWFDDKKWTDDHRVFAHAHEVLHLAREDVLWDMTFRAMGAVPVPRTPTCPDGRLPFDAEVANLAEDACINAALIADGVGKPLDGIFTHPAITPEMSRGQAYAIVWQDKKQNPGKYGQGGGQGQGSGKGGYTLSNDVRDGGSMGDPDGDESSESSRPQDRSAAMQKLRDAAAERQVAVTRAQAAARMAGHGTSSVEQMTTASRAPGIDWRSYVQGFFARAAGNSAFDWQRPSRPPLVRDLIGEEPYYSPSRAGNGVNHVVFVGDTSGSIGPDEHRAILGAMIECVGELRPRTVSVVWCDSDIQRVDTFRGGDAAEVDSYYAANPIPRGGGTDFKPPFEMIENLISGGGAWPKTVSDNAIADMVEVGKPDGLVYVTDLYGDAPAEKPDYPVLWLCTTEQPAPWGECVRIDPQELV